MLVRNSIIRFRLRRSIYVPSMFPRDFRHEIYLVVVVVSAGMGSFYVILCLAFVVNCANEPGPLLLRFLP